MLLFKHANLIGKKLLILQSLCLLFSIVRCNYPVLFTGWSYRQELITSNELGTPIIFLYKKCTFSGLAYSSIYLTFFVSDILIVIQYWHDRDTCDIFGVFYRMIPKDGHLFKKVALDSLSFLDVSPFEAGLERKIL